MWLAAILLDSIGLEYEIVTTYLYQVIFDFQAFISQKGGKGNLTQNEVRKIYLQSLFWLVVVRIEPVRRKLFNICFS